MTIDPIIILTTTTIILGLSGLYVFFRLRQAERDIDMTYQYLEQHVEEAHKTLILLKAVNDGLTQTVDNLSDLRGEYLAQARALDAHDERLQALEDRP